jgi:hypothetical protein
MDRVRGQEICDDPGEISIGVQRRSAEESARSAALGRLRERYSSARALVEPPGDSPHSNLDWILGESRSPYRNSASIDAALAELVVLWLDDLARELDESLPAHDRTSAVDGASPEGSPRAIIRGLRIATREFAEAFLLPGLRSAGFR